MLCCILKVLGRFNFFMKNIVFYYYFIIQKIEIECRKLKFNYMYIINKL